MITAEDILNLGFEPAGINNYRNNHFEIILFCHTAIIYKKADYGYLYHGESLTVEDLSKTISKEN